MENGKKNSSYVLHFLLQAMPSHFKFERFFENYFCVQSNPQL